MCNRLPNIKKEILRDITGIIPHGKVTAIMGASGAGKTSLLNIMACRIDKSSTVSISGQLLVNGKPYDFNNFGDFANYVMQTDILMQTLTVRETLEFAVALKLNVGVEERNAKIMKLIHDLKLEKCVDVLVGGTELKGISGGEKKRTSIAFELISDPQVLFLDEPTSGLDSLTAYVIVWYMKRLASKQNKTIAMTIHQPSSDIYQLFDRLILLVAGKLVYQGSASEAEGYFTKIGFKSP
jgi:ABC-type multidrug transport system ATPase subunit